MWEVFAEYEVKLDLLMKSVSQVALLEGKDFTHFGSLPQGWFY